MSDTSECKSLPNGLKPLLFTAPESHYFGELLGKSLNITPVPICNKKFSNGEDYYRIPIDDHLDLVGRDTILVCGTQTDQAFLFLLRVGQQLATLGTRRRVFITPFYGYSTMERAQIPGEIVTAKANARLLSTIPSMGLGNVFLFLDLHVQTIQYFIENVIALELYSEKVLRDAIIEHICPLITPKENFLFGSSDLGRPLWIQSYARYFHVNMAFIDKKRTFEKIRVSNVIGDVEGKSVIIFDDMIRSGGTLVAACDAYLENGATAVYAVVSHFAASNQQVIEMLEKSHLAKIVATNSHPHSQWDSVKNSEKIVITDASVVFQSAMEKLLTH
ncbi:hypothetical protein P9112_013967 [Eukaryota sp. TZLM1-RC]